jgi:hypothetical protein
MMHSSYILKTFLSFAIILLFTKCYYNPSGGSIEYFKKELKVKNPTVYIFDKSLDEIKEAIEKKFIYTNPGAQLSTKNNYTVYEDLFKDSSNIEDYILERITTNSKIYFTKADTIPLIYNADFHIRLVKIDRARTLIQVITYGSYIVIGEKSIGLIGEIGTEIVQSVAPTSIEEYEILLKIGEALGVKDKMPKLLLP